MKIRSKGGFTLLELMVVLAIIGLIITSVFSMLMFGYNVFGMTSKDYAVQSSVRLAMEQIGNKVRDSKAVFAVPDATFKDEQWNYLTVDDEGKTVVSYEWNGTGWDKVVILGPFDDVTFDIVFTKENTMSKDNTLKMYIEAYVNGGSTQRFDILAGYQALNALQVIDYGTLTKPAKALAYRGDDFHYENMKIHVNVSLVLDTSGSMDDLTPDGQKRITAMKSAAKALITGFASNNNNDVDIQISLVEFNRTANDPYDFMSAKNSGLTANLDKLCRGSVDDCEGGTNIGDGLRRAKYLSLNKINQINDFYAGKPDEFIIKNYVILLTDGDFTYYTREVLDTSHQVEQCTERTRRVCVWTINGCSKWNWWRLEWEDYDCYVETCSNQTIQDCQPVAVTSYSHGWYLADGNVSGARRNGSSFLYFMTTSLLSNVEPNITPRVGSTSSSYVLGRGNSYDSNALTYIQEVIGDKLNNRDEYTTYIIKLGQEASAQSIEDIRKALNTPNDNVKAADRASELMLTFTQIQTSIINDTWHYMGPRLSD